MNKEQLIELMRDRGFTAYAHIGNKKIEFISKHMYAGIEANKRESKPIIVDIEKEEFKCQYNLEHSITTLQTPWCGSVTKDEHFDNIVTKFEAEAKWLSRLS